ncbi:hypothetical protein FJZ33_02730 [Candidatus Poribacteria bacterium]|nr:hypothetical protein [Candidatus Poribacteria bacterium]
MKSFRIQTQECVKTGNRIEVPCIRCSQVNLICLKYKAYCSSGLCRWERMNEQERKERPDLK